jgi:2-oxoglutarate ferredoxin oxidoreductase subunit beta
MSSIEKYLRSSGKPHFWCPGCGNGIVLAAMLRAVEKVGFEQENTVVVSGIGCSSHGSSFVKFHTANTLHGRPLTFATGIKLANPKLNVIVITGDGDATAIGGNHFIHAARRNIDITMIVLTNSIYGMTGGQYSPMTPTNSRSTTSIYGHLETPFELPELAVSAGATYVARGTAYHTVMLEKFIVEGMQNKGFSVIEAICQCPTNYGRRNKMRTPAEMMIWQRDHALMLSKADSSSDEEKADKFLIGKFYGTPRPEYTEKYQELIDRLRTEEDH